METMEIMGKSFPVLGYVTTKQLGAVPLVDVPQMSDYKWQRQSLHDRLNNPEKYRAILNEDVDATIAYLRRWLEEHGEEATA